MGRITCVLVIMMFLLLRPYQLQNSDMMYPDDDFDYMAHATALAFGQFPAYAKEYYMSQEPQPLGAIGPGMLAAPFVAAFSLLDRLEGDPVVQKRTAHDLPATWTVFGFIVASIFYFWSGCLLLYRGLRDRVGGKIASWAVILMILCQGLPLFAFRRPVFSHVFEFFLQALMVYVFLKAMRGGVSWRPWLLALLGAAVGVMILVRYNNIVMAALWPLVILSCDKTFSWKRFFTNTAWVYGFCVAVILIFKVWPDILTPSAGYSTSSLLSGHPLNFYLQRIVHILAGVDWGLLYTAPFLLLGMAGIHFLVPGERGRWGLMAACLLVNLYIVIMWQTQAGWYGYRYLIASAFPVMILPFAVLLREAYRRFGPAVWASACLVAIFPFFSMICFEGNGQLTLFSPGWINPTYQQQVWRVVFTEPATLFAVVFKAGPAYLYYLMNIVTGQDILVMLRTVYPFFSPTVLVKVIILFSVPVLLYMFYRGWKQRLFSVPGFLPKEQPRCISKVGHKVKRS